MQKHNNRNERVGKRIGRNEWKGKGNGKSSEHEYISAFCEYMRGSADTLVYAQRQGMLFSVLFTIDARLKSNSYNSMAEIDGANAIVEKPLATSRT